MFGEFEIIANIPRIGTAYATKKCYLFTMSQDKFMKMLLQHGLDKDEEINNEVN